jgi:SAM-dependent methyltransferase
MSFPLVSKQHSLGRDAVHEYWLNPRDPWEQPETYVGTFERSAVLHELLSSRAATSDRVLEVGCGAGANLAYLARHGYRNLAAVELNPTMLDRFETHYNHTFERTDVHRGPIETAVDSFATDAVDVTVSVAVLAHLHPSSEFVFDELVHITDDYLITIENERTDDDVFFPRNYADVFESRGCTQVDGVDGETLHGRTELSEHCIARVFAVDT